MVLSQLLPSEHVKNLAHQNFHYKRFPHLSSETEYQQEGLICKLKQEVTFIILWHGKWGRKSSFVWRTTEPHKMTDWSNSFLQSFALSSQHNAKDKQQDVAISQGCIPQWTGKTGNRPTPKPQWVKLETRLRQFIYTMFMSSIHRGPLCSVTHLIN